MEKRLVIIDGNAVLHRAWHAMPPLTTKDGTVISAAYGFTSMLLKVIKDLEPTHMAVSFDLPGGTFRHEAFEEYKAQRVAQPQELYDQIPMVKDVLDALGIPVYEAEGYEADDVIGTISKEAPKDTEVIIVTGDLDTLQLVDERTKVYTSRKGLSDIVVYDEDAVKERYGLEPGQLIDYKAIRGDASDNLPGLKGIGEKGASRLLQEHGTLENMYKALKKDPEAFKPRVRKALEEGEDEVPLNKELVTIVRDVPAEFSMKDAELGEPDMDAVRETFQELEFKKLLGRVEKQFGPARTDTPDSKSRANTGAAREPERISSFKDVKRFAFRFSYAASDRIAPKFVSVALCDGERTAFAEIKDGIPPVLKDLFEDEKVEKIGHDMKFDLVALMSAGLRPRGAWHDIMLMSYLLDPGSRAHDLGSLVFEETGRRVEKQDSLFDGNDAEKLTEEAEAVWPLREKLWARVQEEELAGVFEDIETPLLPVLAVMERHGIKVDTGFLDKMAGRLEKEIGKATKRIYEAAGEEFNINSPAQLQKVLFEDLELPAKGIKKTATGQISTAASELEKLRGAHPVIEDIFTHREYAKLLSTYVNAIPKLVHPKTKRLHTTFNQAVTATGRLSSSNPNLQNIPVRTELGREVRKAFVADKGYVLVAADYSQIELRIAASIAGDKKMIEVFRSGEDIHTATAAEVFGVAKDMVTKNQRRDAKAINFGILYGMGPQSLAASTDMTVKEARAFIDTYLSVFSGVRKYMDDQKEAVRAEGWVETLYGRRRYLPEIRSGVPYLRAEAERMAINMPIQGTQADIIKIAMRRVHDHIAAAHGLEADADVKMLLQVHDELIFEVKKTVAEEVSGWIRDIMQGAADLKVPIDVDVEIGQSWGELKEF